jgi:heme/copper-type cytochrome/quinol oxidase subunit 2
VGTAFATTLPLAATAKPPVTQEIDIGSHELAATSSLQGTPNSNLVTLAVVVGSIVGVILVVVVALAVYFMRRSSSDDGASDDSTSIDCLPPSHRITTIEPTVEGTTETVELTWEVDNDY